MGNKVVNTLQNKLVIVGAGGFAEVAAEYFEMDGNREVAGFVVERDFFTHNELLGRPVIAFEEIGQRFSTRLHDFFVAVTYQDMNRQRRRLYDAMTTLGYRPASYVSSRAFIAGSASLGSHCFVMENNVVQPHAIIEDNVILWSGNHVGHHATVEHDNFVSSHVVVSGYCHIGKGCFVGVNCSIADHVTIGDECLLGAGTTIASDLPAGTVCRNKSSPSSAVSTWRYFGIDP